MFDIAAISGALTSLKTAGEILNAIRGSQDIAAINSKVIELQGIIMTAQQSCLTAQYDQSTLLKHKDELETKIRQFENWETEKNRYVLQDAGRGQLAYALKEEMRGMEPAHYLCPNCYDDGRKRILQPFESRLGKSLHCHGCKLDLTVR